MEREGGAWTWPEGVNEGMPDAKEALGRRGGG